MTELISPLAFKWFLTLMTGIVAGIWFVWDAIKLARLSGNDPVTSDKRFGYAMERVVAYTAYLIGFATGAMEVTFYFWLFVPVMAIVLVHDAKRMLVDPV
jgi:hypothetical protein